MTKVYQLMLNDYRGNYLGFGTVHHWVFADKDDADKFGKEMVRIARRYRYLRQKHCTGHGQMLEHDDYSDLAVKFRKRFRAKFRWFTGSYYITSINVY